MNVILKDGERSTLLRLKKGAVEKDLRAAFNKLSTKDPIWKSRTTSHYPTFETYRDDYKMFMEVAPSEKLKDGQIVKIVFSALAPVNIASKEVPADTGPRRSATPQTISAATLKGNEERQREWLKQIGCENEMDIPTSFNATQSYTDQESSQNMNDSFSNETLLNDKPQGENSVLIEDETKSSGDEEYSNNALRNRAVNLKRLSELNIVPPKCPKLRKKRQPKKNKGKENGPLEPVQLRRSSRVAACANQNNANAESVHVQGEESDPDSPDISESPGTSIMVQPQGPTTLPQSQNKPKKQQALVVHRIGELINQYKPLPPFTDEVLETLKKGIGEQNQGDAETLNKFMVAHVKKVTGGISIKKSEYSTLRTQLEARLKLLKIPQHINFSNKIVYALSVCLRNMRREDARKEKDAALRAAKAAKALALANEALVLANAKSLADQSETGPSHTTDTQSNVDSNYDLLRKPVINETTVLYAMQLSSTRYEIIKSMSVRDAMTTYPYLNHPKLVIHDYLTRVSLSSTDAEEKFESALLPLKMVLDMECIVENELDKLQIILKMDEHFNDNQNIWPLFQCCDDANQAATPLDKIPINQSPAAVILKNDRDACSTTIVFDGEALLTLKNPTSFQSVALLMAWYFIFNLEYPPGYMKQLRILEILIHGERLGNENIAVKKFLEKVFSCKQMLVDP